jgi:asparagine synthetase B (glutamine-hydrolysing)
VALVESVAPDPGNVRALTAGLVEARPDPRGINQIFTFFALPGPVTCFAGIQSLLPGHFLRIQLKEVGATADVSDRVFWEIDFPDRGAEEPGRDARRVVDDFEELLLRSVNRRLRADVPVVAYLSGGVDSSTVVALASRVLGRPIPTFTIQIKDPALDETTEAAIVSRHVGAAPIVVGCGAEEVLDNYPRLIHAAESPVIDTSCTALLLLAEEVHAQGVVDVARLLVQRIDRARQPAQAIVLVAGHAAVGRLHLNEAAQRVIRVLGLVAFGIDGLGHPPEQVVDGLRGLIERIGDSGLSPQEIVAKCDRMIVRIGDRQHAAEQVIRRGSHALQ